MPLPQLRRVRWAVRASLVLGVAASVSANVLHANPNPIAQTIAAWPPLALLLTVELISRVPIHRRDLAAVRLVATAAIAGIAAWVSYWHMMAVAARYGESGTVPYLLPLSVDGLVIVGSVSLVELAGRIRIAESAPAAGVGGPSQAVAPPHAESILAQRAPVPTPRPPVRPATTSAFPVLPPLDNGPAINGHGHAAERTRDAVRSPNGRLSASVHPGSGTVTSAGSGAPRKGRPIEETRRLFAELSALQPDATDDELATQLGISTRRLKAVLAGARG